MTNKTCWFKTWFDSPYYHILYQNRDQREAGAFIDKLIHYLQPSSATRFWDLGCGRGRHSIYINQKGYQVIGTDLSAESIHFAAKHENNRLSFYKHDMRYVFRANYFNCVLNLFTSFGYFNTMHENELVFRSVYQSLKPGGIFILDYLNATKAIQKLVPEEEKTINGIHFHIKRKTEHGFILKQIKVTEGSQSLQFEEKVRALQPSDFDDLAKKTGFTPKDTFGDYSLCKFAADSSDRLILVFQK